MNDHFVLTKTRTPSGVLPREFCENFKNSYSVKHAYYLCAFALQILRNILGGSITIWVLESIGIILKLSISHCTKNEVFY